MVELENYLKLGESNHLGGFLLLPSGHIFLI